MRTGFLAGGMLALSLAVSLRAQDVAAPALPPPMEPAQVLAAFAPGQGREVTAAACGLCHSPVIITGKRFDADTWAEKVDHMIDKGAQVADQDYDAIVDYLAVHYGPDAPTVSAQAKVKAPVSGAGGDAAHR